MIRKIDNITLATHLDKRKMSDGKQAVKIRLQYQGRSRYYSTKVNMTPAEYNRFNSGKTACEEVSRAFNSMFQRIERLCMFDEVSWTSLLAIKGRTETNTITSAFDAYTNNLIANGQTSTAGQYTCAKNSLLLFAGGKDLELQDIDKNFIERYIRWCRNTRHLKDGTIRTRLQYLNSIMTTAMKDHSIKVNPLKDVQKPQGARRNSDISEKSLKKLLAFPPESMDKKDRKALLYWQTIYYANGININDLVRLRREDMKDNKIVYCRTKTKNKKFKPIIIPIIPELKKRLDILATGKEHIFPVLDGINGYDAEKRKIMNINFFINSHVKAFCKKNKIPEKVTTYSARHMFATSLLRKGVPIEYISSALGHSSIRTTEAHYLEGYTEKEIVNYNTLLTSRATARR